MGAIRLDLRYRMMRWFHGDRPPDTMIGEVVQYVRFQGRATMAEIQSHFESRDKESLRSTVNNAKGQGLLNKDGDYFIPAFPVPVLSYPFLARLASISAPFLAMFYAIQAHDGSLFAFAFLMFAIGAGSLAEVAAR